MKTSKLIFALSASLLLASCTGNTPAASAADSTKETSSSASVVSSSATTSSTPVSSSQEQSTSTPASSTSTAKKYRITFDLNGGMLPTGESGIDDQYVEEGHWAVKPLLQPVKKNCTFLYWAYDGMQFNFSTQIYGDLNLIATYRVNEENKVTLTFDPNNGEPTFTVETFVGDTISPRIPSKQGMAFKGWYLDGNENKPFNGYVSEDVKTATKIVALYAQEEFSYRFSVLEDGSISIDYVTDREIVVISIPETIDGRTVTTIKEGAFGSLSKLKQVNLPKSIRNVTARAFLGSYGLTTINVDGENQFYKSVDGVLFNRSGSELIAFPSENATTYSIPAGTKKIAACAFYASSNYSSLTSVNFPEGLEEIGERAFYNQKFISTFVFPSSLKKIGDHAFMMFDSAVQVTITWNDGLEEIGDSAFSGIYIKDILALPDSVRIIGEYAFSRLNALTGIVLPANLESIGQAAFFQNYGVKQITMPLGNPNYVVSGNMLFTADMKTLVYCPSDVANKATGTDKIIIPEGVENLMPHCLSDIRYFNGITLPSTLKVIGESAFHYNFGLRSIVIPDSVTRIEESAFDQCAYLSNVTIGSSVSYIGKYAFADCEELTSIDIPGSVKRIEDAAFFGTPLSTLTFHEGLEEIGESAFYYYPQADEEGYTYGSSSLATVTFPDSLKSIGDSAFAAASTRSLRTVTFGKGLESVGQRAFENCPITVMNLSQGNTNLVVDNLSLYTASYKKLLFVSSTRTGDLIVHAGCEEVAPYAAYGLKVTGLSLPEGLLTIGDGAFASIFSYESTNHAVEIPGSVKTIGDDAFRFANNITSLTFHEGLEEIGASAFSSIDITSLALPNSLKRIGDAAFHNVNKLATLTLGNGLVSIGEEAFYNCYGITGVLALPATLEEVGPGAFACTNHFSFGNGNKISDFALDSGNTHFAVEDGILYNKEKTEVIACAPKHEATSITLPSTVKKIGARSLNNRANLASLTLPEGLEEIGDYAFQGLSGIRNLTLPASATKLGRRLFDGWLSTQSVTISYTKECTLKYFNSEWDDSSNATIIYGSIEVL